MNKECCGGGGTGGAVVEVAECGVGSQKLERSEVVMKASMTEELSSQMLFILFVGGERCCIIPWSKNRNESEMVFGCGGGNRSLLKIEFVAH